ncbi:MAG: hypothetical protein F4057_12425 [Acidobacteria bacterium]|nr:hypothetical protein [Acidobacteriota bacterium]
MMRCSPNAARPVVEHCTYGHGYEQMRRQAVEPGAGHDRNGLAAVTLRGVAAWLQVFAELPAPPAPVCGRASAETLPAEVERSAIDILLAMLNSHMGREQT